MCFAGDRVHFVQHEGDKQPHEQVVGVVEGVAVHLLHLAVVPLFVRYGEQVLVVGREGDAEGPGYFPAGQQQIEHLEPEEKNVGFLLVQVEADD